MAIKTKYRTTDIIAITPVRVEYMRVWKYRDSEKGSQIKDVRCMEFSGGGREVIPKFPYFDF